MAGYLKRFMPRRSKSQPDPLATFPEWARRLADRYYTKTVSTFILHGAVRDLQPADDGKGGRRFVPLRIADGKSLAFVIDFAETVAPAGDLGFMPGEDRYSLVTLVKWAQDPQFLAADFSVCLVAENLTELNPRIGRNPYASGIEIPLPTEKERLDYIEWKLSGRPVREVSEVNAQAMAQMTAGMSRVSLDRVLTEAMGFLIAGPIGTGKTFLATCFAGEIGIPCVKFLNFRSQWQGVTEGNLEKIFNLLKAMWPVAVIVDEADAFLGNRNAQGDSGTSARVFSQIASFMGNTEYRGKIVWFLLTSRPDLLPVDLKRQGRAEEHLALFYPESHDERLELVRTMAKKARVQFDGDLGEVL